MKRPLVALLLMTCAAPAAAAPLGDPAGQILLTVTGKIETTNADDAAEFDLAMLEALPVRETTTMTPWYDEVRSFSGPLLSEVLEAVGADGTELHMRAVNNYEVTIPAEEAAAYPIILATRIDGAVLSVRDKGPIFVIYPWDLHPELYNEMSFSRSVWQVQAIDVR